MFPGRLTFERDIIEYLTEFPADYAGALRRLPKKLRKMFVNAVQSYIWNKAVEEFLKDHKPEEKEIVLPGCDTKLNKNDQIEDNMIRVLGELGLTLYSFNLKSMPELKCTGGKRDMLLVPKELKLLEILKDEFNEGKLKATISFSLRSGSYATIILNEIMKSSYEDY